MFILSKTNVVTTCVTEANLNSKEFGEPMKRADEGFHKLTYMGSKTLYFFSP